MLNVTQLRDRIVADFPDAAQVADTVVRFVRSADNRPYAVCYVDVAEDLPRTQDDLTKYQDRVIGQHYFQGRKSLQWSNYLYFVTNAEHLASDDVRQAKELIEADRSYARKFVILEDELDDVLSPSVVAAAGVDQQPNVLSIWTRRLVEAGLDGAILSDADLPKRLEWIELSGNNAPTSRPKPLQHSKPQPAPPFIRSLQLTKYRHYPLQRQFLFGTVNLVVGPNAAGKTSLLEAIELFYCGRNKRSPDKTGAYEFAVALVDGRQERGLSGRRLQIFRDRNLAWYGRPEVKTNNLYQSFAQFNFLDTDAAVDIADSTASIEDDLSKLLVGPDASRIWRNMERVSEALTERLRDLRQLERQISEERAVLQERLKAAVDVRQESDSIASRLNEMLERLGWGRPQPDNWEKAAAGLVSSLSELAALAEQVSSLEWVPSPVSLDGLAAYCAGTSKAIQDAEPALARLEILLRERKDLEGTISSANQASDLAGQARRMIEARVPDSFENRGRLQDEVARNGRMLAGADSILLESPSPSDAENLVARHELARSQRSAAEQALAGTRNEYATFTALRDKSLNLAQQLRQIAGEILKESPAPDECPLCHTRFGPGELASHMTLGVDQHLEALGQNLLGRIRDQESALRDARAAESAYLRLKDFGDRCGLSRNVSVGVALTQHAAAKRALADAQERLANLDAEMHALESQGLSHTEFQRVSTRLAALKFPPEASTPEAAAKLVSDIAQSLTEAQAELERRTRLVDEQEKTLQDILRISAPGIEEPRAALSQMKENLATTQSIVDGLGPFLNSFPWPPSSPIAELIVVLRSVRTVASELQTALRRERSSTTSQAESVRRKEILDRRATELAPKLDRLAGAHDTLRRMMREDSLNSAMQSVLRQNRAAIESIFSRIHSPAEFSGLGKKFDTLVRKEGGNEASLREISTGQRAAFALSIFLAQNSQLTAAPRVMLIDDPIAHVDDLNSLSFLDYLREIAVRGQRQIFFATANDKIASLFERKFDFLGEEDFRKFELSREHS